MPMDTRLEQSHYRLKEVAPDIAECISASTDALRRDIAASHAAHTARSDQIDARMDRIEAMLRDIMAGGMSVPRVNLTVGHGATVFEPYPQDGQVPGYSQPPPPHPAPLPPGHTVLPGVGPAVLPPPNPPHLQPPPAAAPSPGEHGGNEVYQPAPIFRHTIGGVPQYQLSRNVRTVPEAWTEWSVGRADVPPVEELEERYSSAWRRTPGEKVYFCRRKVVIDEIKRLVEEGRSVDEAVAELERIREENGFTLYRLHDFIRANRKV